MAPTVKIKLSVLRELIKEAAEYYRVTEYYGGKCKNLKKHWFSKDNYEYTPFDTWEESWANMVGFYPFSELKGLMNSQSIDKYISEGGDIYVDISLNLAGKIGYAISNKES